MRFTVLSRMLFAGNVALARALAPSLNANTSRMMSLTSTSGGSGEDMIEATDLFGQWARTDGRVEKMAAGHDPAVSEMLTSLIKYLKEQPSSSSTAKTTNLSLLDIGSGSGWVCKKALDTNVHGNVFGSYRGIDGSNDMVLKAQMENSGNPSCLFEHADLNTWSLQSKEALFDVAFSMECLYYLRPKEIGKFLRKLSTGTIKRGGVLIFGIDHYEENKDCHNWSRINNCHMTLWPSNRWKQEVEEAGFEIIDMWRAARRDGMLEGTLVIMARNTADDKIVVDHYEKAPKEL